MQIQPSINNREFPSGAVRGDDTGKGLPSLLPWQALRYVSSCFDGGWAALPWKAVIEVAKVFEAGARKYAPRNWEAGMPLSCYVDSATRHFAKFAGRETDEPHAGQYCWNLLCLLQMELWVQTGDRPELLQDLPAYTLGDGFDCLIYPEPCVCPVRPIDSAADLSMDMLGRYVTGSKNRLVMSAAYGLVMLERHVETSPRRWLGQPLNAAAVDVVASDFYPEKYEIVS